MTSLIITARVTLTTAYRLIFFLVAILLSLTPPTGGISVRADTRSATDGHTPAGMSPGAPSGSFPLSGFDNVNLFNGGLNFHLPLIKVGGRGAAGYTMMLPIEQHWRIETTHYEGYGWYIYTPTMNWWTGLKPGYGPGVLQGRQTGDPLWCRINYSNTFTRLTFTAPDGTEYELRDTLTEGAPGYGQEACGGGPGVYRGNVWVSTDGTSVTFIADYGISDAGGNEGVAENGYELITPSGYLLMRDGTRYRIDNGKVTWIRDRNGNQVNFTYDIYSRVRTITDSLGRQVTITYDVSDAAPYGLCDHITYSGFGGTPRTIRVSKTSLSNALRSGQPLRRYVDLFPEITGSTTYFNPTVFSAVWLPDGRSYQFRYNSYSELARVVLPTGGAYEYDWAAGATGGPASGTLMLWNDSVPDGIYRRVVERRTYHDGVTLEGKQTYSRPEYRQANGTYASLGYVIAEHFDAAGTRRVGGKHYFYGSAADSMLRTWPKWTTWKEGKEYQTEALDTDGVTLLRRVVHTWQQRAWLSWAGVGDGSPPVDPRITETITTLLDTNQVSKQTFGYDQYNNRTDVWEYDFGAGAAPPYALRHTQTTFLTTNPVNGQDYASPNPTAASIHVRSLPQHQRVYSVNPANGAETLVAHTETLYDETSLTPWYGAVNGWSDPGSYRGNATRVRRWRDQPAPAAYVETRAEYDQVGNVTKAVDALGREATIQYSSTYHHALPTGITSPVPDPTGQHGSNTALTTATAYDFSTGLVTSTTDANGRTTTYEYNDVLDRLTRVNLPDGGRNTHIYVDTHQCGPLVETRTLLDNTGREVSSWQFLDGLGRPYLSETYDNQDPNNPYFRVDTRYDTLGRVSQVSNPYRTPGCTSPANPSGNWKTTTYDALGRVRAVTTPDGAAVKTAYSGNLVQVTDQAGRSRRSRTDALGRLAEVVEFTRQLADPYVVEGPGPSDYVTAYQYDALGNLRKVDQGGQLRFFMYNSLGRLIRAKNPEQAANGSLALTDPVTGNSQWSLSYAYDNNGNLTSRVDARGVASTYQYDALNRNTTVRYTDGTKDINRHYDGAINGRGRFWYFNWDPANNTRFDTHLAMDEYDAVGRPKKYRQHFLTNGVASPQFLVTRSYDLAGHVTSQTYPSGHTVNYSYDASGRLASFTGNIGDGVQRTYSTGVTYSPFGGIEQEQFGTQTPLYHKLHYNRRGQLFDIRLSTVPWATDQWNWNRGAIVNYFSSNYAWEGNPSTPAGPDNNGNVMRQQHWVPTDDAVSSYSYTQASFAYDHLNRLTSVSEVHGGPWGQSGQDFVQAYDYDRWGNRTINAAGTWTAAPFPAPQINEQQFSVDPNTNRLGVPSGQSGAMTYDNAGNLTYDSYTGQGARAYDAEGRLTSAQWFDGQVRTVTYTYDADGRRIKRNNGVGMETWQVYGIDGELLAEYRAGAAPFLSAKEYGYRGGEMLTTVTSGDPDRLRRFVKNLYYNALARDPSPAELQQQMDSLAQAGAQGGESQLLTTARSIARNLFLSAEYTARGRTDQQYVTDLYNSYLQRGPDAPGLNYWVANTQANGRVATLNAFEVCTEFATLAATVYGTASGGDNQRVETFVRNFYYGAYQREPTSTEMQQQRQRLNAAAAQGQSQVVAEARAMGGEIFQATNYNSHRTNAEYVTDLYVSFLQRQPDGPGLNYWANNVAVNGRAATLEAFKVSTEYSELAGTLYREAYWLVADHLGTPRMVADKSGSLSGVRRHDYLPFGEELLAGTGGRTSAQGYTQDSVRQKFTGYERDVETNLDYAQARYFASSHGRFTSTDPLLASGLAAGPQTWNRYAYVLNNPLRFTDPTGMTYVGHELLHVADASQQQQQPAPQPTQQRQRVPGINQPEDSNGITSDEQTDVDLAFLFGDCGSIVRGASAARGTPHMTTPTGELHTFHMYGDTSGEKISRVFIPEGFVNVTYEGGNNNQVRAENEATGEVLVIAHVKGISSQADLDRNLNSGVVNEAGSRLVGFIGGPEGDSPGYNHVHVTLYDDAAGRKSILKQRGADGWGHIKDFSGYANMRSIIAPILNK